MTTSRIKIATGIALTSALLTSFAVLPAFALTGTAGANVSVNANSMVTTGTGASGATNITVTSDAKLVDAITKGDQDLTSRITALTNLNTKVSAMVNVSGTAKSAISSEVQTDIATLTNLKSKIDAETDVKVLRTDLTSAINSTRIYALVIPQGYIEVSADRVNTIGTLMTALGVKLQTRLDAAKAAGKNVTALETALTDIGTQTASAHTESGMALAGVANLTPDAGNVTIAASNKAALVAARDHVKTANTDLKAARKDIATITAGLKALHLSVTASSTVQAQ